MKLLSLFFLLLLWQIPIIRRYLEQNSVLLCCLDFLEKFLVRFRWFSTDMGLLVLISIFAVAVSLVASFIHVAFIRFFYESGILIFAVSSLQSMEFTKMIPPNPYKMMNHNLFDQLPESIWRINYCWIAPLFCYGLFGMFGLAAYWGFACLQQNGHTSRQFYARNSLESLCWLPARILAFAYVVVGNFATGIKIINEYLIAGVTYNQYILQCCMFNNLQEKDNVPVTVGRLQRDALILLLGAYAFLVILGWII